MVAHPGLAIWGTLEARVQAADRVILGGLNEGVWPRLPGADPWLDRGAAPAARAAEPGGAGRARRRTTSSRRRARARWCSTRATRDAEAPTVASRWLLRLENLLAGLPPEGPAALAAARARGARWLALADRVAAPDGAACRPPAARRRARRRRRGRRGSRSPTSTGWSATPTRSTRARCCGLRRLDPPGRKADALTRGNAIHAALDAFVARTPRRPRPRRRGAVPRRGPRGLRRRGALAGGQRALDRAADARRALVPRRRGRAPRRRHARPPARSAGSRLLDGTGVTHHRPRRPHRPHRRRLRDLRLQVRLDPEPRRRRARATCSCRSRRRSPRRAASTALAAGPVDAARADPLRRQRARGDPARRRPGRGRRDLGAARRRWSATTSTRPPASSPACGRASTPATTTTCRGSASGPTATSPTRSPGHDRRDRRRRCAPRGPTPRAGSPPTPARARPGC